MKNRFLWTLGTASAIGLTAAGDASAFPIDNPGNFIFGGRNRLAFDGTQYFATNFSLDVDLAQNGEVTFNTMVSEPGTIVVAGWTAQLLIADGQSAMCTSSFNAASGQVNLCLRVRVTFPGFGCTTPYQTVNVSTSNPGGQPYTISGSLGTFQATASYVLSPPTVTASCTAAEAAAIASQLNMGVANASLLILGTIQPPLPFGS